LPETKICVLCFGIFERKLFYAKINFTYFLVFFLTIRAFRLIKALTFIFRKHIALTEGNKFYDTQHENSQSKVDQKEDILYFEMT